MELECEAVSLSVANKMFIDCILAEHSAPGQHKLSDDGTQLVQVVDPTKQTPPKKSVKATRKRTRR
jgi:hypothetical protein